MKRIAIFQSDLGVGGIQKSLLNLLRNLDYSRFQVDLYLSDRTAFWSGGFPKELKLRELKPAPRAYSFLPFDRVWKYARFEFPEGVEYDLAADFNSYQFSCAAGALRVPAKKRVMWIHNDVREKLREEWKYRVLWRAFESKFRYYDAFVPVSEALVEPFRAMSGVGDKPFITMQNYIDVGEIHRKMLETPQDLELDESCVNLAALGRLCHQKGYDRMLDAFAAAAAKREDLRLYIIGDGPDRRALEESRDRLGLGERARFLGSLSNPYSLLARMDGFVSSSRYEGQPLNIMEARAVGLPLYCTKNLEQYTQGLRGCEDLAAALASARKTKRHPDDLRAYNGEILRRFEALAGD